MRCVVRKTKLRKHQVNALKFHLTKKRSADWSEMGVGKTLIALEKIRLLYNADAMDRVLVTCPLSAVETWADEIEKHTTFTHVRLTGSLENKMRLLATTDAPIYLISFDAIPGRQRTLGMLLTALRVKDFHMLVVDEATGIKGYSTIRTRAITGLADKVGRALFLSGTILTNKPTEILTIYRAMDGGDTFGKNFFAARNMFFENRGGKWPDWRIKPSMMEEFHKRLYKNASRLIKKECLDLPEKVFQARYYEMDWNSDQGQLYHVVANDLLKSLDLPEGKLRLKNSLVKVSKLSQITSGFVYTDKDPQHFNVNPKLDMVMEVINNEIGPKEKVVIFARWKEDLSALEDACARQGYGFVSLSGSTLDRGSVLKRFREDATCRFLISQITAGAYSLTLTEANTIIYYSMGFSFIEWQQSQDRIHRIGQERTCVYVIPIMKNCVDEYIYNMVQSGMSLKDALIDKQSVQRLKNNLELILGKGKE